MPTRRACPGASGGLGSGPRGAPGPGVPEVRQELPPTQGRKGRAVTTAGGTGHGRGRCLDPPPPGEAAPVGGGWGSRAWALGRRQDHKARRETRGWPQGGPGQLTAGGRGGRRQRVRPQRLRPEGPAWEGEGPSPQRCGHPSSPERWALKPAHCPARRPRPGCPAVAPSPCPLWPSCSQARPPGTPGAQARASLPSSPDLGVQGPTLPGGPGRCPRLP